MVRVMRPPRFLLELSGPKFKAGMHKRHNLDAICDASNRLGDILWTQRNVLLKYFNLVFALLGLVPIKNV